MTRRAAQAGFSLVELLVSVTLLALLAGALHQLARGLLRGVRILEIASEAQQSARIGAQLVVRELRGAGFAPAAPLRPALGDAGRDHVSMASDLNGDGDTDDSNERVEYRFDAGRRALMRALGNAPPQPMLMDVDALELTYLDADGAPVPLSGGAVAAADLGRIRRVDLQLVVAIGLVDSGGAAVARNRQTGTAFLRNG
jgi:prepilin-type N-terminal cleavage/methylation domain-containing protein